jgi:hypothetical protein
MGDVGVGRANEKSKEMEKTVGEYFNSFLIMRAVNTSQKL